MEIPSWAGKVATVAGLSNPVTAPVVVGQWVAEKAKGALGPKNEAPPAVAPNPAPQPQPKAERPEQPRVANESGQISPKYTQSDTMGNGNQKLLGADGKWNGTDILNGQTQFSKADPSSAAEQENRCGPSAVLASQVMKGKDATASMAGKLAGGLPEGSQDRKDVEAIQGRIADGTATHEDLSRLQHQMYKKYHPAGQKDGLTTAQVGQMEKELTGRVDSADPAFDNKKGNFRVNPNDGSGIEESPDNMKQRLDGLRPGQSFVQFVDTTGKAKQGNHFVLMGKDDQGRPYVYDPGAKTNQPQVVFKDERPTAYSQYSDGSMGIIDGGDRAQMMAGGVIPN